MITAVKEWAKDHIHIGVDNLQISSGSNHYIKDCKNVIIYDSATVETAKGFSTIITSPYSKFNNKDKLILLDNAMLKDNYGKIIYQSGDYKLVCVKEGKIK